MATGGKGRGGSLPNCSAELAGEIPARADLPQVQSVREPDTPACSAGPPLQGVKPGEVVTRSGAGLLKRALWPDSESTSEALLAEHVPFADGYMPLPKGRGDESGWEVNLILAARYSGGLR